MPFRLIEAPEVEPLDADALRQRLNLPASVSDATLDALEKAARLMIERQFGLAMITQTLEYVANYFPGHWNGSRESGFGDRDLSDYRPLPACETDIVIPYTPITKIISVKYADVNGVSQTLDPLTYTFTAGGLKSRIAMNSNASWPSTYYGAESVVVRFEAGFADSGEELDELFKMAVVLNAAHLRSLTANNLFVSSDSVVGVGQKTYTVGDAPGKAINNTVLMLLSSYVRPSL